MQISVFLHAEVISHFPIGVSKQCVKYRVLFYTRRFHFMGKGLVSFSKVKFVWYPIETFADTY